jgi:hypothetical protein
VFMSIGKKVEHYLPTLFVATCGWSFWYIHVLGLPTKMDNKSNDGAHPRHVKLHFKRKALVVKLKSNTILRKPTQCLLKY